MTRKKPQNDGKPERENRRLGFGAAVSLLLVLLLALGATGTAAAQTDINGCTNINSAGSYEVTQDVDKSLTGYCFTVTSDDVVIDGNGNTINATTTDPSGAIRISNAGGTVSNVTIENLFITNFETGIAVEDTEDVELVNIDTTSTKTAVLVEDSTDVTVESLTVSDTDTGVDVQSSTDVTVRDSSLLSTPFELPGFDDPIDDPPFDDPFDPPEFLNQDSSSVGVQSSHAGASGIRLNETQDAVIENNTVSNFEEAGVLVSVGNTAGSNEVTGNEVVNNTQGVIVETSGPLTSPNQVVDNEARANDLGIGVLGRSPSPRNEITGNELTDNGDGIYVLSEDEDIIDNTVSNSSLIGVGMTGVDVDVRENTVTESGASGIHVQGGSSNDVVDNIVEENEEAGIRIGSPGFDTDNNTLVDNTANENDVGILVEEGSSDNLLELNEANENTWGIIVLLSDENELVENEANHNDGEFGAEQPLPPIIEDFPGIGIKIAGSADTTVQDNEANQNGFTGISVLDSSGTEVDNNDVHENGISGNGDGFGSQFGSGIGVFRVGFFSERPPETPPRDIQPKSITPASHTMGIAAPNRITNNDATGNQVGITLLGATDNILSDNTATENFVGIRTLDAFNNTFTDDTSRNNIEFDYMDMTGFFFFGDSLESVDSLEPNDIESPDISDLNTVENLNIGNSEKPNTEVSFKTVNFVLRGTSAQPPANPEATSTGRYFEAAPTFFLGEGPIRGDPIQDPIEPKQLPTALLDIDLHYKNSDIQRIDESSLGLWGYEGFEGFGGWLKIENEPGFGETGVDEQNNVVSWNYTLGTLPASQNELTPQNEGEVSPIQLPVFGAFGESTGCVNRRNLGRGQENSECPFDRDVQRGGSREELDRSTGRGGDGRHRDSATSRRNRGRGR